MVNKLCSSQIHFSSNDACFCVSAMDIGGKTGCNHERANSASSWTDLRSRLKCVPGVRKRHPMSAKTYGNVFVVDRAKREGVVDTQCRRLNRRPGKQPESQMLNLPKSMNELALKNFSQWPMFHVSKQKCAVWERRHGATLRFLVTYHC